MLKKLFSAFSLWVYLNFAPTTVHACAVCFGGVGSNLSRGFFWGIVLLLLLPFLLIGIMTTLIVRASKKTKHHVDLISH